jgi:hypothetical protein
VAGTGARHEGYSARTGVCLHPAAAWPAAPAPAAGPAPPSSFYTSSSSSRVTTRCPEAASTAGQLGGGHWHVWRSAGGAVAREDAGSVLWGRRGRCQVLCQQQQQQQQPEPHGRPHSDTDGHGRGSGGECAGIHNVALVHVGAWSQLHLLHSVPRQAGRDHHVWCRYSPKQPQLGRRNQCPCC